MPTAVNTVLLSVSFKPISVDFTSVLNIVSLDRTSTVTMFAFATAIVLWYTIVVVQVYYELLLLDGYIYIASTPPPPPPPSPPHTHTCRSKTCLFLQAEKAIYIVVGRRV